MTITLTTDFGEGSSYVAAMKGVILGLAPHAHLIDLSHSLPAQDIRQAALFCEDSLPWFPSGTIHVIVVDPGVGTSRALLHIEAGGQHILAPDNGCWTLAARRPNCVRTLTQSRYWRPSISSTFHGRDILAPVAAQLYNGVVPAEFGEAVDSWVTHVLPVPNVDPHGIVGEVLIVDPFGNLITNIPAEILPKTPYQLLLEATRIDTVVKTYGEARTGTPVALVSSSGRLEIAVVQGNAAKELGARVQSTVTVLPL